MSSGLNEGLLARISGRPIPAAMLSRITETMTRVPRMQALTVANGGIHAHALSPVLHTPSILLRGTSPRCAPRGVCIDYSNEVFTLAGDQRPRRKYSDPGGPPAPQMEPTLGTRIQIPARQTTTA